MSVPLARAVLALAEENEDEAIIAAQEAKSVAPRSASVREVLGLALYRTGSFKSARSELSAAQRFSGTPELVAVLADLERAVGRPERAVEMFEQADRAALSPETAAELLVVAASAYGDLDRPAAGAALIRRHMGPWPSQLLDLHLRLAYVRGDLADRAGNRDEARELFTRVLTADPDFFDAAERLEQISSAS